MQTTKPTRESEARILLIEDDEKLGGQVAEHLRQSGFTPTWLKSGEEALVATPREYALVVLDLMLPGVGGLEILKHLRSISDVPVLVLSAKSDAEVKVKALELGADDYVTKPFWPEELIARVHARLRRPGLERAEHYSDDGIEIDGAGRTVRVDGAAVEMTKVEFELLWSLARRPGQALSRAWLVSNVLDPEREGGERTLDVHVSRIRKKLGRAGERLATVWGVGYRLDRSETK